MNYGYSWGLKTFLVFQVDYNWSWNQSWDCVNSTTWTLWCFRAKKSGWNKKRNIKEICMGRFEQVMGC